MKLNIKILLTITTIIIGFSACGGGSGDTTFGSATGSGDTTLGSGEIIIPIDVNCTTPATIATYIPLQSGDTIIKEDDNTSVNIYHDLDGTKKVCLDSGKAHILRGN